MELSCDFSQCINEIHNYKKEEWIKGHREFYDKNWIQDLFIWYWGLLNIASPDAICVTNRGEINYKPFAWREPFCTAGVLHESTYLVLEIDKI